MPEIQNKYIKMKVFAKGQVVIPVQLRKEYHIEIGDRIDVISTPEGILLKSNTKKENINTLTERLFGIFSNYASDKTEADKNEITKATEKEFTQRLFY